MILSKYVSYNHTLCYGNQKLNNFGLFLFILLKKEGDTLLFGFLPIDHFDYLEENPESIFNIKCKSIEYDFIKLNE